MSSIKQISVFLENKPGTLQEMTAVLASNNIDLRALSLAETIDFGIARLIVDDVYKTSTVLKDAGYINKLTPVVAVRIPDEPGGLNKLLDPLTRAQVNLEYMYSFLGGNDFKSAYMIIRVPDADVEKAANILTGARFELVDQESIAEL